MPQTEWLSLEDAAELIGKSQKTIMRFHSQGLVRSQVSPVPGRKSERLYHAGDLERIQAGLSKQPEVALVTSADGRSQTVNITTPAKPLVELLREMLQATPLHFKLWLTLEEANQYSGIPKASLIRMRKANTVTCFRFGRFWRYRRDSLKDWTG